MPQFSWGGAVTALAEGFPAPDGNFPTSDESYTEDVVLPGYGDISQDLTLTGNGSNTLTISDDRGRGNGATLSVIGGTTTFKDFDSFVMLADHTGSGDGYAIQGLYVLHGPTISFENIRSIELGTDANPLVNTYAIVTHSGTVQASGFDNFSVRSSHGIWATNSGGASTINLDGGETGVIDIKTTSFAVDVDAYGYTTGYENAQSIQLKAKDVSLQSTQSRAVIVGSGIEGANSTLTVEAVDNVVIDGATNGIEIYGYENGGTASVVASAGQAIVISGGENAVDDTVYGASDKASINLTAPAVAFGGNVNAASTEMTLRSGTSAQPVNVQIDGDFRVKSLAGDAVNINAVYNDSLGSFEIGENTTEATIVSVTGDAVAALSRDEAVSYLDEQVNLGREENYSASVGNAAWNVVRTADDQGNVTTQTLASELTESTMDIAALTMVAWRNETTNITDRMATLRTNPASFGAWVRFNGGEYSYDGRDVSNQFQTIEVGGDVKVGSSWVLGASLSYTKGNGEFTHGENDSDTYAGALYALWTHESGSFVDAVAKIGRLSSDFDFRGVSGVDADSGSLDQTGFIFGIETGHRFDLPMNAFVEPQIQVLYSRLGSDSETTAARHIEVDSTDSLIGRIGVMGGLSFPDDKGSVYARVSALHDFLGDVDGTFRALGNNDAIHMSEELDSTWVEFSVGADYRMGDNTIFFADVQRSAGGDIDLDWRLNLGAKFVW